MGALRIAGLMAVRRISAWWGPGDEEAAENLDPDSLDALLDRLDEAGAARPFLVDLSDDGGGVLTIGVGAPVTVLLFETPPDPPYLTSFTGQPIVDHTVWFDYAGAESEFGPEQIVPREAGREVARTFASNGSRSGVDWIEV